MKSPDLASTCAATPDPGCATCGSGGCQGGRPRSGMVTINGQRVARAAVHYPPGALSLAALLAYLLPLFTTLIAAAIGQEIFGRDLPAAGCALAGLFIGYLGLCRIRNWLANKPLFRPNLPSNVSPPLATAKPVPPAQA